MTPPPPDGRTARDMTRADVHAVTRIEADRHELDAWSSTLFHEALDQPERYRCLVATGSEPAMPGGGAADLVAYGIVSRTPCSADLDNLTVRRDHARRGIGRWMLGLLLDDAARLGAREVLLEVRDGNTAALALYDAEGFVEIHRRRGYYAVGVDAIVMRRPLDDPSAHDRSRGASRG